MMGDLRVLKKGEDLKRKCLIVEPDGRPSFIADLQCLHGARFNGLGHGRSFAPKSSQPFATIDLIDII
jgi:hypothetical protein